MWGYLHGNDGRGENYVIVNVVSYTEYPEGVGYTFDVQQHNQAFSRFKVSARKVVEKACKDLG